MARTTDERKPDAEAARDAAFARQPGHERQIDRDIDLRSVATTVLGILVGTVIAMIAMGLFLSSLSGRAERRAPEPSPIPEARAVRLPPGPRLQARPEVDYQQFRAEENLLLSSYGWADRREGTVRIPIERAMELLVERGVRVAPPEPGALGPAGAPSPQAGTAFGTSQEGAGPENGGQENAGPEGAGPRGGTRRPGGDPESGATQGRPEAGDPGTASGQTGDGDGDGGGNGSGEGSEGAGDGNEGGTT